MKADDSEASVHSSQNNREEEDVTKERIVPIVHAPGYELRTEDLNQYESIRNPMRIKEETLHKNFKEDHPKPKS